MGIGELGIDARENALKAKNEISTYLKLFRFFSEKKETFMVILPSKLYKDSFYY